MTIENQIFGVANASNQTALGIMGIGPSSLDGFNKSKPYSLILESLATQGHINSRAFSLDLRDYDNSTGMARSHVWRSETLSYATEVLTC